MQGNRSSCLWFFGCHEHVLDDERRELGRCSPPYLLRPLILLTTPPRSRAPRTSLYLRHSFSFASDITRPAQTTNLTPGRSCALPPRTNTTLCSCKLCPSPWMYAVTLFPVDSFTRATLRLAELGFLGLTVRICVHTAFFWKQPSSAGDLESFCFLCGFRRMLWLSVMHREGVKERVGVRSRWGASERWT